MRINNGVCVCRMMLSMNLDSVGYPIDAVVTRYWASLYGNKIRL